MLSQKHTHLRLREGHYRGSYHGVGWVSRYACIQVHATSMWVCTCTHTCSHTHTHVHTHIRTPHIPGGLCQAPTSCPNLYNCDVCSPRDAWHAKSEWSTTKHLCGPSGRVHHTPACDEKVQLNGNFGNYGLHMHGSRCLHLFHRSRPW